MSAPDDVEEGTATEPIDVLPPATDPAAHEVDESTGPASVSTDDAPAVDAPAVDAPAVADPSVADPSVADPSVEDPAEPDASVVDDQLDLDDPAVLQAAIEAVLFVSDVPVLPVALAAALRRPEPDIAAAVRSLGEELDRRGSGIELREVAGGYRLYSRSDVAAAVEQFLREGQRTRLTQAALETLAVIAYRQPISRGRVSAIRGVNVDGVVRTLLTRGLVAEVGTDPDTSAGLYATTELFLEKLGLSGIDELPSLAPLLPDVDDLDTMLGDSGEGIDVDRL